MHPVHPADRPAGKGPTTRPPGNWLPWRQLHSGEDPQLTSSIYSRFGFDEDAAAMAKLPSLAGAAG